MPLYKNASKKERLRWERENTALRKKRSSSASSDVLAVSHSSSSSSSMFATDSLGLSSSTLSRSSNSTLSRTTNSFSRANSYTFYNKTVSANDMLDVDKITLKDIPFDKYEDEDDFIKRFLLLEARVLKKQRGEVGAFLGISVVKQFYIHKACRKPMKKMSRNSLDPPCD